MRMIRCTPLLFAVMLMLPATVSAQAERPFTDSWFWGAKVGALAFSTTRIENGFAPTIGAEWLITRNRGALYLSLDRSFFNEESSISDPGAFSGSRIVNVRDLTRFGFALLAFPRQYDNLRPYGGVGMALSFIQRATPREDEFGNPGSAFVEERIEEERSRASFQMLAGVQVQLSRVAAFGQVVVLPFESNFLLNGRSAYSLEAGLRFNVGSAVDNIR
jgi:hypothetical protein